MSRQHISKSKRSRSKAREARREAREVREMLKMPVKTRRGSTRRSAKARKRLFTALCGLGVTAALLAGLWILITKAFYDNPEFTLTKIEAQSNGRLTQPEIEAIADIPDSINLLKIDIAGVDARLRALSQVKDVQVERHVPGTLEIKVWERRPVAWLGYRGGDQDRHRDGVLLDAEGYAICCRTLYPDFYDLPVILVPIEIMRESVFFGRRVELPSVHVALELIDLWPSKSPDPTLLLSEINASRSYRLDAQCYPEMRLVFDMDNLSGQLIKLGDALRHAATSNRHFAEVNLTVAENIPVIYHPDHYSPILAPPARTQRPSGWPQAPSHLSEEEMQAILTVDS